MRICARCVLPETFPGISFDEEGVCSHCQESIRKGKRLSEEKDRYRQKFLELVASSRSHGSKGAYDLLMAYSGGKDSTYALCLLRRKYDLRVLAVSFDNGFIAERARINIKTVVEVLGVDHIMFKPRWDLLRTVFTHAATHEMYSRKSLERASTICTTCIGLVKSVCLKMAIEQEIPLIGFGWSPGQAPVQSSIMRNNPSFVRAAQEALLVPMRTAAGNEIEAYFLSGKHYSSLGRHFYNVHPLAWEHYDEGELLDEIKMLGWREPEDTDSNSSNCLLNAYANEIHVARYGFHPYVWEIANMVREGSMERSRGYAKIYESSNPSQAEASKRRLVV